MLESKKATYAPVVKFFYKFPTRVHENMSTRRKLVEQMCAQDHFVTNYQRLS